MNYFIKYVILPMALTIGLIACIESCDSNPTAPNPDPDPTTTTTSTPPGPPPIDPTMFPRVENAGGELWVDGELLKATTAFSLVPQGPGYATSFCQEMRMHGVNTARIFVETGNWVNAPGYLAQVAFPYNYEDTKKTIESLGQAGCAVEIVIIATLKEEPLQNNLALIRRVAQDFGNKYKHLVWSVANEYKHPSSHSSVNSSGAAKEMLRLFNSICASCIVGVDEHLSERTDRHRACQGTGLCDFYAWHPDRNDEDVENNRFMRGSKRMGRPTFYDEMVAFASDQNLKDYPILNGKGTIALFGRGTESERWRHTNEVYNMAIDEGISPCWHAIDQMLCLIDPALMWWPDEHR
ncbi:MAG: hypothetical protein ACW99U_20925 [Candidatus Thorarchaeota archaeon]|jgi:hypothetical protein